MGIKGKVLLSALAIGLFILCAVLYTTEDRKGPTIQFGADVPNYSSTITKEELLSNVTAKDAKDGDVSNTLFVDSIRVSEDGTNATVTYVALDSKKNVSRASQVLSCNNTQDSKPIEEEAASSEAVNTEETEETEDSEQEMMDNPEVPVLQLSKTQETIGVQDSFDYSSFIESIEDDKDDFATLSRRLRIAGDYKTKAEGTYDLTFSVTDTDGNVSNEVSFTLIRQ